MFRSTNNIEGKNDDFNGLTMELVYSGESKSNVKKNPTNTIMKFEDISTHTNQLLDQPHPT